MTVRNSKCFGCLEKRPDSLGVTVRCGKHGSKRLKKFPRLVIQDQP